MGTTDDQGLSFDYHAEQDRRGGLLPERGRRSTAIFEYGGDGTFISAAPLPVGVSDTQGCVFAFTALFNTTSPDFGGFFSVGRVSVGSSRGLSIGFETDGFMYVQLIDFDNATGIQIAYSIERMSQIERPRRFAVGVRPNDPNFALVLWIDGVIVATRPRGAFSFATPWIGHPSWYGLRDDQYVRPLYRQVPHATDVDGRPNIDYYLGTPSLVGKRRSRLT